MGEIRRVSDAERALAAQIDEQGGQLVAWRDRAIAAEQDAARYRWLRDSPVEAVKMGGDLYRKADTIYLKHLHLQDLDAAIDAALKGTQ